ncbi:hypothetical protein F4Z99_14065 [Candidatus Poribacteria bacterium]|nr:hypothetical protein [Candidatus Poribacteria bacterium]MYB01885.1 hypothetical protein [Candidatus Poribacteria bacterium]
MEKIKFGVVEFRVDRIHSIRRVSHYIAEIRFKTDESIHVICGTSVLDNRYSYPGTYEQLKALIGDSIRP